MALSVTVREVLARHDVSLTEAEVAETLERALESVPAPTALPLSAVEVGYLSEHAGPEAAEVIGAWEPAEDSRDRSGAVAGAAARLLGATLGIHDVAKRLGVDRSRISHRISADALYSFTVGSSRRRRIPAWQVTSAGLLPRLEVVVPAIPAGAHPIDVEALMTTGQDELGGRTPVEHLAGGGDPQPVVDLVEALGRWRRGACATAHRPRSRARRARRARRGLARFMPDGLSSMASTHPPP